MILYQRQARCRLIACHQLIVMFRQEDPKHLPVSSRQALQITDRVSAAATAVGGRFGVRPGVVVADHGRHVVVDHETVEAHAGQTAQH